MMYTATDVHTIGTQIKATRRSELNGRGAPAKTQRRRLIRVRRPSRSFIFYLHLLLLFGFTQDFASAYRGGRQYVWTVYGAVYGETKEEGGAENRSDFNAPPDHCATFFTHHRPDDFCCFVCLSFHSCRLFQPSLTHSFEFCTAAVGEVVDRELHRSGKTSLIEFSIHWIRRFAVRRAESSPSCCLSFLLCVRSYLFISDPIE